MVGFVSWKMYNACKTALEALRRLQNGTARDARTQALAAANLERAVLQRTFISYINMQSSVGSMRVQGPQLLRQFFGYARSIS